VLSGEEKTGVSRDYQRHCWCALCYILVDGIVLEAEARMKNKNRWSEWWREFLGFSADPYCHATEILSERYLEKSQHMARFTQHAERMQYPQFRKKLLEIAEDEKKHLESLAEKINTLGDRLPNVPPVTEGTKNSWQYLLEDLTEEQRSAPELLEQAQSLREQFPDIAEMLERIYRDGVKHREAIRDMLMKSDPQSLSSWLA
jgi:rubrerythrin